MLWALVGLAGVWMQNDLRPSGELLPKTPPDWRYEQIDFPLSFAPDLKFKGFEQLRFAPGMFDAQSDTYFTYILLMKITNRVKLDAASVKDMLQTYYRGLCRTVAKQKKFKIDESKIVATVRPDHYEAPQSSRFVIELQSYDPFVTGKPLRLHIEMLVIDAGPADLRLFASVSPKPPDDDIWKTLHRLESEWQKSTLRPNK